jgi:hypothetical protein
LQDTDLRRGEPDAIGVVHGFEQVLDERLHIVRDAAVGVEHDGLADLQQLRVGPDEDLANRHGPRRSSGGRRRHRAR